MKKTILLLSVLLLCGCSSPLKFQNGGYSIEPTTKISLPPANLMVKPDQPIIINNDDISKIDSVSLLNILIQNNVGYLKTINQVYGLQLYIKNILKGINDGKS